jgi:hypothetical protein
LLNTSFLKFALQLDFFTSMPAIKTAEVPLNPREFFGEDPEEVVRKVKSFDSNDRRLLPVSHRGKMWAQMTTIQRRKVINAMSRKSTVAPMSFLCVSPLMLAMCACGDWFDFRTERRGIGPCYFHRYRTYGPAGIGTDTDTVSIIS